MLLMALVIYFASDQNIIQKVDGELFVHCIDVGQGDCILITSGNDSMLIDVGEASEYEKVREYLAEQNITRLNYLVATHPHSDHMGGMAKLLEETEVGECIMPHLSSEDVPTTKYFNNFLDAIENKNVQLSEAELGRAITLGDAKLTIVAPCSDDYGNANNYSVGILLRHGEKTFLFMGDAEKLAEKEIIANTQIGHVDVYKVDHHGSDTSSCDELLAEISPDIAVISCGEGNRYGHPHDVTLEKLQGYTSRIYRTDRDGTVKIKSDGKEIYVDTGGSKR